MTEIGEPEPYILVFQEQLFLVIDCMVLMEVVDPESIPILLISAYFVFNIQYPKGCNNFFSFLEVVFLNGNGNKLNSTVKNFCAFIVS